MASVGLNDKQFTHQKQQCLSGVDLSRKGSVDSPVLELVSFINEQPDMFTTSSCSGRTIIVDNTDEHGEVHKQGCKWLYVTHAEACAGAVKCSAQQSHGAAVFKFEPMVMHIQVQSLDLAQSLHATAVASGFRNSGISIGGKGKIIMAVRSTHSLDVPLSSAGHLLVSDAYLEYLVRCANLKMQENISRISRFFEALKNMVVCSQNKPKQEKRQWKLRTQNSPHLQTDNVLDVGNNTTLKHTEGNNTFSQSSQDEKRAAETVDVEECFQSLLFEEET